MLLLVYTDESCTITPDVFIKKILLINIYFMLSLKMQHTAVW